MAELRRGLSRDEAPELYAPNISMMAEVLLDALERADPQEISLATDSLRAALRGAIPLSQEAMEEQHQAMLAALEVCVSGVSGPLLIGDQQIDEVTDPARLVGILDALGFAEHAFTVALEAQAPTETQSLSSGS